MSELGGEDDQRLEARLADLDRRLRLLEERLRDGEVPAPRPRRAADAPRAPQEAAAPADGRGSRLSRTFELVAVLFGVLAVALLLRTLAEQHWLARSPAATLGLVYCAVLLAAGGATAARRRATGLALAGAGCVLAQAVVVEGYHRYGFPGPLAAWGVLGALALAAVATGRRTRSPALGAVGFVGSLVVAALLDVRGSSPAVPAAWLCGALLLGWAAGGTPRWGWAWWTAQLALGGLLLAWAGTRPGAAGLPALLAAFAALSAAPAALRLVRGGAGTAREAAALPLGWAAAGIAAAWAFGSPAVAPFGA
ncbi:MAG: DUF2339 domain-containing protein, partial [Deltaproteobacteria bacterium]|nr:DUF2339 domain-containing protein [Deltaproteobacteria bacterium]